MSDNRPNILLLMTDQQRYDSLGCYGCKAANTPNLDRLAEEGVLFEQHYVTNTICTPSRASMLTGKHLPGHGVCRLYDNLPKDEVLVTQHLQKAGYRTALFGKLHVSAIDQEANHRHPNDGFDIYQWCVEGCARMDSPFHAYSKWLKKACPSFHNRMKQEARSLGHVPTEYHMTHWAANRVIDFIDTHESDRPFFAMMSIFDPHDPYNDYPPETESLVDAGKIPDPLISSDELEQRPAALKREETGSYLGSFESFSLEELRSIRHGYHISLAFADREFGRVLEAQNRKGLADNTLVIFTSDHGDMLGDHHLLVKGAFFYDPVSRVPLILRWPRKLCGDRRIKSLVQNLDLAATILNAAGIEPGSISSVMPDSRELISLAEGDVGSVRDEAVCLYRNSGLGDDPGPGVYWDPPIHASMIRHDKYKLNVWHGDELTDLAPEGELYNLEDDPNELTNLWNDLSFADTRYRLTKRLLDWFLTQELQLHSRGGSTPPAVRMQNKFKELISKKTY
jgi:arylsulfatase A-like enzyme